MAWPSLIIFTKMMRDGTTNSSNMTGRPPIVNPYAKKHTPLSSPHGAMGRQSQQRNSLLKRTYQLAASNNHRKKKKGDQVTLAGEIAFDPTKDCKRCVNTSLRRQGLPVSEYKKPHHQLCSLNQKTKGKGPISDHTIACMAEEKRLTQLFKAPLQHHEKPMSKYVTPEATAAFFSPRTMTTTKLPEQQVRTTTNETNIAHVTPSQLCQSVTELVNDSSFVDKHKSKTAPLAMIAFADVVSKQINQRNGFFRRHFVGLTMTVPVIYDCTEPDYHSIMGQRLLLVDWMRYGITVPCPDSTCAGNLANDRTNFSKNKTLFPIFGLDGPPAWCIVMSMVCSCCKRRFDANSAEVLVAIPPHAANHYPVDTKYALTTKNCHLAYTATEVFDSLMLTYGNGDLCSTLLYGAINKDYLKRITSYYSVCKNKKIGSVGAAHSFKPYVSKDGTFIKLYPPHGDTIRDCYDEAANSSLNHWGISDHDRHTREIQSVRCDGGIFCQDHTFQAAKNYQKSLGAAAVWDVGTSTGEIACAVLVPSTKTRHFSHAAIQLAKRQGFQPKAMYSDTWPNKAEYWKTLFPGLEGRLGLFHFEKRIITSTLKKGHVDCMDAITDLLSCMYVYCNEDYENLLQALKTGALSATGKTMTAQDIADLQGTKLFRDRYAKYLRKEILGPETMRQKLDDWFCKYKVTSSDNDSRRAGGRLDPIKQITLFTGDTKPAVENCKEKVQFLADPMPLEYMYDAISPSPNATHNLSEYLSRRGESKLEAFHDRFAHFGNGGMRRSLCDNLNLCGTARFNRKIRHKRRLISLAKDKRTNIPAGWEKIVPYWNHAELAFINTLSESVGSHFLEAEPLPEDNGERFFSDFIAVFNPTKQQYDDNDMCLCELCTEEHATTKTSSPEPDTNTTTLAIENVATTVTHNVSIMNRQQQQAITLPPPPPTAPAVIAPTTLWQYAPLLPTPMYMPPPVAPCCTPYQNWCRRRVGRPPHHPLCRFRMTVHGYSF